jgi:hypothetical protein
MKLEVKADLSRLKQGLKKLGQDIAANDKAMARAINKASALGRTEMARSIRDEFMLTVSKAREKLQVRKAFAARGKLEISGELFSKDPSGRRRAINLASFGAKATRRGLTVKIKRGGPRVVLRAGFLGNKARTAFERVGSKRLPIKPLQTIDVPQMFNTKRINQRVRARIEAALPGLVERELRFILKGGG